jgi:hypothetical protein
VIRSLYLAILTLASPTAAASLPSEILTHSLTALALHVTNADAFAPVVEEVVKASKSQLELKSEVEWEKLVVVMKSAQAVAGVKKGGRVPGTLSQCFFALVAAR